MSVETKLKELSITLPPAPKTIAAYVPAVKSGNLLFLSGVIPLIDGKMTHVGKLGKEIPVEDGYEAARITLLNTLSIIKTELGSLDRIERIVKLTAYVASSPGFTQQPKVVNGASDLLIKIFGAGGSVILSSFSLVSTVIGFPLGHSSIAVKIVEAMEAVKLGAQELEIMINLGPLKAGDEDYTLNEIRNIINVSPKSLHKIIIEIGLLNQKEKKKACQIILKTGAAFVKTSTGFGPPGATVEDIRLLARETGKKAKVKASGGIRTLQRVVELWKAGASRIGTSAAVSIMKEYEGQFRFQNHHSKAS